MQSLSLRSDKPLDATKFMPWLQNLVASEGQKILRSKGILAFSDDDDRYVFQGVHMMLEGDHQRAWKDGEARESRLVFIGRELPEQTIRDGFEQLYHHVMKEFDPGEVRLHRFGHRQVRRLAIGMPVIAVHFLGDNAAFVGAEENVAVVNGQGEISPVAVHGGGILCAASDGARIVMGGDDGKLVALDTKGEVALLATDSKAALDRQCRAASRRRGGVVGRQDRLCPQRQGRGKILRRALDGRRSGVCAEGPAARGRAL